MDTESKPKKLWDYALKFIVVAIALYCLGRYVMNPFNHSFIVSAPSPKVDTIKKNPYWSDKAIAAIKVGFMQRPDLQPIKPKARSFFCDCYINQLVKRYPNGVVNKVTEKETNEIASSCGDSVRYHQDELVEK